MEDKVFKRLLLKPIIIYLVTLVTFLVVLNYIPIHFSKAFSNLIPGPSTKEVVVPGIPLYAQFILALLLLLKPLLKIIENLEAYYGWKMNDVPKHVLSLRRVEDLH